MKAIKNWWDDIPVEQNHYWRFRPVIKPEQWTLFIRERNHNMAIDMKDPENVRKFSALFIDAKKDLAIKNMSPEQILDHVKDLENALELLIFEKRAAIQGSRDLLEEMLKDEKAEVTKKIREKDKASKYRPSLNQLEQADREARKIATVSAKQQQIDQLITSGLDRKKAEMVQGFMKLGMSEAKARALAGC